MKISIFNVYFHSFAAAIISAAARLRLHVLCCPFAQASKAGNANVPARGLRLAGSGVCYRATRSIFEEKMLYLSRKKVVNDLLEKLLSAIPGSEIIIFPFWQRRYGARL